MKFKYFHGLVLGSIGTKVRWKWKEVSDNIWPKNARSTFSEKLCLSKSVLFLQSNLLSIGMRIMLQKALLNDQSCWEKKKKIWKKCCNACESAWSKHGKVIPEQSIGFHFNWTFDLILVILTFFVHGIWFLHFDIKKDFKKVTKSVLDFFF